MIPDQIIVEKFQPIQFFIQDIGPFQESIYSVDFTDSDGAPCNLFLLLSKNGNGKTTILRTMFQLMHALLLPDERDALLQKEKLPPAGKAQLDIFLRMKLNGETSSFILSLTMGRGDYSGVLNSWTAADLEKFEASDWHSIDVRESKASLASPIAKPLPLSQLRRSITDMHRNINNSIAFMESMDTLPSVVWLPTRRRITSITDERPISQPAYWGYSLAYDVSQDAGQWNQSLDNLLVWMKWLDDGSLERAMKLVNEYLFEGSLKFLEGVRKSPPEAIINNSGQRHRLDQLSSGEQSMIQILLRIGAHMTQNSVILIDELELHLHPNWQHKLLNILKRIVRDNPSVSIIASTHSREILGAFPLDIQEDGVRKGGDILHGGFS